MIVALYEKEIPEDPMEYDKPEDPMDKLVAFYFNEQIVRISFEDGYDCEYCPLKKVIKKLDDFLIDSKCRGPPYTKPKFLN